MKITIIGVGKVKEKFYRDAIAEFEKRLGRYVKLQILEVADEKTPDGAGSAVESQILQKEGERILKALSPDSYCMILDIGGKKMDSVSFSNHLNHLGISGKSHITFIIGGSLGLCPELKRKADFAISFSDMTFPHQLMRVILLEQIYRGYRIINGEPYHK